MQLLNLEYQQSKLKIGDDELNLILIDTHHQYWPEDKLNKFINEKKDSSIVISNDRYDIYGDHYKIKSLHELIKQEQVTLIWENCSILSFHSGE